MSDTRIIAAIALAVTAAAVIAVLRLFSWMGREVAAATAHGEWL